MLALFFHAFHSSVGEHPRIVYISTGYFLPQSTEGFQYLETSFSRSAPVSPFAPVSPNLNIFFQEFYYVHPDYALFFW